ncbi:2,3-bisphosphoglycerate-independent phosphoglycerate mutase [Pseudodesulfovibrio profundus]|uniref:2,3-bisphosphoglycerate-independent phosphoglycerate mutase n=1 Tax=Pseudodesulfovibrio profundus TaxID=57320 RepID=A0A2C8F3P5_9BACT|nr:cofactor-independent phosphoglycerate mutase [Pseudodesulfovibrio profundus]SOB57161.1 2,3-bisphosphoglycerate-independent phosphoglycerate mutase [Pseudodesulfovibrio profundus]
MKVLYLIADGMGGWPLEELGGKTTMEAADTPNMDELAKDGIVGVAQTVPEGMQPGSDVANMALLGFDPARYHTGRGPIEAAAQGLELSEDDLVWRLNLVTVSQLNIDGYMRDYSSGHIDTEVSRPVVEALQEKLGNETYTFIPGIQYRHLLVQKDGAKSDDAQIAINPPHDITDKPIKLDLRAFSKSPHLWDLVFEAKEILENRDINMSMANSIWPWGQGRPLSLPNFTETFGLKGGVISAVDLIKGLGFASGMDVIEVEGATGLLDTNYQGKVDAALEFLKENDFVFVHLEGPDECGHGGNAQDKVEAINRFDAQVVAPLREALKDEDVAWIVTCDHFTPIAERTHTMDAVPFLINGSGCAPSNVPSFSEAQANQTGVKLEEGHTLLSYALDQLGLK